MVFSLNLLYACTMKTIPAIETNRPTKKILEAAKRMFVASRKISKPPIESLRLLPTSRLHGTDPVSMSTLLI
jgi:hypothetical protein